MPYKGLVESIWFQFWLQKWMDRVLLTPSDVQLRLKNQQSDGTLKLGRNASGYLGVIFKNCLQFLYQTRFWNWKIFWRNTFSICRHLGENFWYKFSFEVTQFFIKNFAAWWTRVCEICHPKLTKKLTKYFASDVGCEF